LKTITLEAIDAYISEKHQNEAAYLKPASSYVDAVIDMFYSEKRKATVKSLPWMKTEGKFDLRPSEVTLWLGFNGHGKSLILGQMANGLMKQGAKVCIASFEMKPHATMQRMCRQAACSMMPSKGYIREYHRWTNEKLWIYDQFGSTPPARIVNLCEYAVSIGITHIIIDSLMKVVDREDDYNGQKSFVNQLCILARDFGLHIHLVHHSRKGMDESKSPSKMDAKGTGAITDLVDNCVSVWRSKKENKLETDVDCLLTIDKQRHGEWEGKFALWYHDESQSYCETDRRRTSPILLQVKDEQEYAHDF
jgi:twinkle protein